MTDSIKKSEKTEQKKTEKYTPPKGSSKKWTFRAGTQSFGYSVISDWLLIRRREKPIADIFFTYYSLEKKSGSKARPIAFVFNGGPGSSSVYLHVGGIGPKTVTFSDKGQALPPPAKLKDNPENWLEFSDLVFIDPIGTGFSRSLEEIDLSAPNSIEEKNNSKQKAFGQEFYKLNRDLESICEFIQRFLSKYHRWSSPVYIVGESYGGFRVGKLAKKLQESYGVGLKGAVLISPVLEFQSLSHSDYDNLYWIESFPSLFAVAAQHGKSKYYKSKKLDSKTNLRAFLKPAEEFALNELNSFLVQGDFMIEKKRAAILQKAANFLGIPVEKLKKNQGRLSLFQFCRSLLKNEGKWCGIYDGSVVSWDPFPDRDSFEGPDPTAQGNEHVFTHGINTFFREWMNLNCERQYRLLNSDVNKQWKSDQKNHFFDLQIGAIDDLRYAMSMNPYMKVFICHGIFDLATPYFSSQRGIDLMRLPKDMKKQLSLHVYHGGHMFYTWTSSRKAFKKDIQQFYK